MATFSPIQLPWLITGETEKERFIDIDSGGAELGQSCAKEDCKEGTCFQADDNAEEKCMYVLMPNEKGCSSKHFNTCTQGLICVDDTCVFPNQKPPSTPTSVPTNDNEKFDKFVMYSFMVSILVLILIMLILVALGFAN